MSLQKLKLAAWNDLKWVGKRAGGGRGSMGGPSIQAMIIAWYCKRTT